VLADDIAEFADALLLEKGRSKNTCAGYATDLRLFAAFLKTRKVETSVAVTRAHIVDYLGVARAQGLTPRTRARRTAAIRAFFRFLCERHRVASDPTALLDPPKKGRVLPRVLSEDETTQLLESVKGTDLRDLRDRALLEVLYGCGLRVSEACDVKLDAIVSEGELLRVFGKGSKERVVPIGQGAGEALTRYFASARDAFTHGDLSETHIFVTRRGRPFTRQGIFKIIRERAAAVGIASARISPHVLRHSYASHMLAHGADIRAIQELLGHADIGTTQVYTHVDTGAFGKLHRQYHPRG